MVLPIRFDLTDHRRYFYREPDLDILSDDDQLRHLFRLELRHPQLI